MVCCPRLKGPKSEVESPKLGGHDNVWKTYFIIDFFFPD